MSQPTKITTGKVRFSYVHVWEPDGFEGNEPKYSVSIIIPKTDTVTINKILAAVEAAKIDGKSKLADANGNINPNMLKTPLRDGDIERSDDPAYRGCYFLNASSKNKPQVVDANVNAILQQSEFYSGCFGRVSVNFYAFNTRGNKGVAAGLNNIQKIHEGEALAGGSSAEEDFGDGYTDQQQQYQPQPQQQYQQQPQQQYQQQPQQQYQQQPQQQYQQQPQYQQPPQQQQYQQQPQYQQPPSNNGGLLD